MTDGGQDKDQGLTLIELVAAMAIFALIAVMGLQSLTATLRTRDRLAEMSAEGAALSRPLALLRGDLSGTVPMLFYPPGGAAPHSALRLAGAEAGGEVLAFSVAGQPALDQGGRAVTAGFHRVEWRLADGMLYRRVWTVLDPAGDARSPEVVVMEGVSGMDLRSYWPQIGWQAGVRGPTGATIDPGALDADLAGGAAEVFSDTLPLAIEVTLEIDGQGTIPLLETLR
ncbi:type II secretion system protein GspJ [uncultured Tateyamaria sp.]|uniref:type II secretion system protein GspJ n=1 Tax=uncultured Tateyamaria sp. TaxID=455651 RepID=UPI00262FC6D9|nr:type II secretion system protein GspJ [uncultured Tateyamaria sp.]